MSGLPRPSGREDGGKNRGSWASSSTKQIATLIFAPKSLASTSRIKPEGEREDQPGEREVTPSSFFATTIVSPPIGVPTSSRRTEIPLKNPAGVYDFYDGALGAYTPVQFLA